MKYLATIFILLFLIACGSEPKQAQPKSITGVPAIDDITRLIFKEKNDPNLYFERAKLYLKENMFDNAIYDLEKAIKMDSLKPGYFHLLSDAYMDNSESKSSILTMDRCLRIFPERIPSLLKMSETQFILKQYETSMIFATKVLSLSPQEAEGYFMMGMNFKAAGEEEKALNSFQTAIEMDNELIDAWLILGDMYEKENDPLALKYYEGAVEADTSNIQAWHSLAYYFQNHEKIDEALEIYRRINRLDKFYPDAFLNAGILYLDKNNFTQAEEQFTILTKVAPQNYLGHFYLGVVNELNGKYDQARENLRSAQNLNADDPRITKAIVRVSEKQGK